MQEEIQNWKPTHNSESPQICAYTWEFLLTSSSIWTTDATQVQDFNHNHHCEIFFKRSEGEGGWIGKVLLYNAAVHVMWVCMSDWFCSVATHRFPEDEFNILDRPTPWVIDGEADRQTDRQDKDLRQKRATYVLWPIDEHTCMQVERT